MRKLLPYALIGVIGLAIIGLLRQRRRPIPNPPALTFLFENPLVEAFAGSELLVEQLGLAPGMRVLDAGCGPGRLTIPVSKAVGPTGEVVALDSQRAMLEKLERRLEAQGITNVRTLEAGLGEGALEGEAFDRVLLAFVLGEVRDRAAAAHELYAALKPGGILSVTEGFGDPDYRRPTTVRHEVEPAGFRLVERFGGFPAYTLNFQKPEKEEVGSVVVGTPGTGASVLLPAIGGVLLIGLGLVDGEDEHEYSRGHLGMHQASPGCIRSLKVSGNR